MSQKTQSSSSEMITLGQKWECFSCSSKFYDLGKSPALCPKCGADQEDESSAPEKAPAKKKATKKKATKKKATKKKATKKKKADEEEE